tara:strand:- start:1251 stop:1961 length:711 start_codon:yes stop_codon:yes gene_type:complete
MSEAVIQRPRDFESPTKRCWGTRFYNPKLRAADIHEMIVSDRAVEKLDDLTAEEEADFWALTMERLNLIVSQPDVVSAGFFINDGKHARQTASHVHVHVLGFKDETVKNFARFFTKLKRKFADAAHNTPLHERSVKLKRDNFEQLRMIRDSLRANYGADSFSIFVKMPLKSMKKQEIEIVIQAWSQERPSQFSLTNMVRCCLGMRKTPHGKEPASYERFAPVTRLGWQSPEEVRSK